MTHSAIIRKTIGSLLAVGVIALYVVFVPPNGVPVITGLIGLVTAAIYIIVSLWTRRKFAVLAAVGTCLFLGMNAIIGFEILNTILLASFIIGTAVLIK